MFFLEIVHLDLCPGKVWEFSIFFSFCTPPGEISGLPLLIPAYYMWTKLKIEPHPQLTYSFARIPPVAGKLLTDVECNF